MAKWKCGICEQEHDEIPMDIAYARPQHYLGITMARAHELVRAALPQMFK